MTYRRRIYGAWLVQIKDAGHAMPIQYPDKLDKVLQTFLSTTTTLVQDDDDDS